MTNKAQAIRGNFDFLAVASSFPRGEDAEALYEEVSETIKSGILYDSDSKTIIGSSPFLAARVDSIIRPLGIRVATLTDLSKHEVMEMIKDRYYSDTPAIVFRAMKNIYKSSDHLTKKLVPLVEEKMGKLELPILITGFDVVPSEDREFGGLDIVPREDFTVLHDERLSRKYNERRFSTVDENGLPNFERNGNRTWYARNEGISRLFLYKDLSLGAAGFAECSLFTSNEYGRIVLVHDAVASAQK